MRKKDNQKQTAEQPPYGSFGSYQLTEEQLKQALQIFRWELIQDSDTDNMASNLLCVLRAFTYTANNTDRETMLHHVEESLMPYIGAAFNALDKLAIRAHKQLIKVGGTQ